MFSLRATQPKAAGADATVYSTGNSEEPNGTANSGNYYFRLQGSIAQDLNANRGIYLGNAAGYGGGIGAQSTTTLNVRGPISGPGGLWIGGGTQNAATGPVVLFNTGSAYAGGTYIVGGTLRLGDNNVLPTGTPLTLSDSSAVVNFDMNGKSQTIGPVSSGAAPANPHQLRVSGALTIIQTNDTTFSGVVNVTGGVGSLTLAASSTRILTLAGSSAFERRRAGVRQQVTRCVGSPNADCGLRIAESRNATSHVVNRRVLRRRGL